VQRQLRRIYSLRTRRPLRGRLDGKEASAVHRRVAMARPWDDFPRFVTELLMGRRTAPCAFASWLLLPYGAWTPLACLSLVPKQKVRHFQSPQRRLSKNPDRQPHRRHRPGHLPGRGHLKGCVFDEMDIDAQFDGSPQPSPHGWQDLACLYRLRQSPFCRGPQCWSVLRPFEPADAHTIHRATVSILHLR
jgi:hypothetical protein